MTRYAYPWPNGLCVLESEWRLTHRIARVRSLLTGAVYQTETHRPRYQARASGSAGPDRVAELEIFLARLRGGHNLAWLADWERQRNGAALASYAWGSTPILWESSGGEHHWDDNATLRPWNGYGLSLVSGAAVDAPSFHIKGFLASRPAIRRGAELGVGAHVYRATADADADANGEAVVFIAPRAVALHPAGTGVNHAYFGLFVLTDQGDRATDSDGVMRWSLSFTQVFEDELGGETVTFENKH